MKQRLFLFVAILVAMAVPHDALAYDFSYTYQGKTLYYTIVNSNNHRVSVVNPTNGNYYSYVTGDVMIPDSVENNGTSYAVTSIHDYAFCSCTGMTSVSIPNSVTSIGGAAFYGCTGLTSVSVPNSVTSIGGDAFSNCTGMTSISIPNSVTSIGSYAFFRCTALTSISIPNSVTVIGVDTFYGCTSLTSVSIPNSVTFIGGAAFYGCTGLTSISIPNSVTNIGTEVFCDCRNLLSIVVEEGNTHYDSRDNCNAIIQTDLNMLIYGCNATVIPNSVTNIGNHAFYGCIGLTSASIPNSVTSIGGYAFSGCTGLTSVLIPNSVTSIGYYAFSGCTGLTSVSIPNSVTSIGDDAFYYTGLTSVYCSASNPPTLGSSVLSASSYYLKIYVPCSSVDGYKSAAGWSNYSSRIYGMPELDFTYSITANNDTMGTVNVGMVDCDSNVTVTATVNTGYQFNGWSDGGTDNPRTFHLTGDTNVTALFDHITYAVVGQSANAVRGTVTGCDTVYYGDTVVLTATPNYGYHFTRWNDNSTVNPRTVVTTNNLSYTAYFAPNTYTVTVISDNAEQGTVGGSSTITYLNTKYVYATPATGYHFTHWSDGSTDASRYVTVEGDTTLTAYFEINSYTLTVLPNDNTLGIVTGSGTFTHGTQVTVTATPTPGNRFDRWSDNSLLTNYTFTLTSNLQLVAVFIPVDTVHVHDTTVVVDTLTLTEYVPVHDTTYIDVHDTTYIDVPYPVHDTTYIDVLVHDTSYFDVHDTTYIDVPYPVHDTTYIDVFVHDTTYIDVHDTTYFDVPYPVHDTTYIDVFVHDTTHIDVPYPVHDTTYIDVFVHDTTVVVQVDTLTLTDTVTMTEYVQIHDTTYIDVPYTIHDTTTVTEYIFDTVTNTEYVYDTITNTVYDTIDNYIYDTTIVTDTLWLTLYDTVWLTDTIYIHDTVFVPENGIDDVQTANIRLYQRDGQIVVEEADGGTLPEVAVYDAVGRMLNNYETRNSKFEIDVPASGVYLLKIGDRPARRIVVIR